ncbi:MAG: sugar ABC transporter permease [Oscillospiraceae bacterium]|nr:sugar ABC transporter permease [Oscillospiraceae bacterium]
MMMSLWLSFTNYKGLEPLNSLSSVGFANYIRMFTGDPRFWVSVRATLIYAGIYVPLRLAFALFVAMLFTRNTRVIALYRTAYYLPSILGGSIAIAVMWRNIFGLRGLINFFLIELNIITRQEATSWLREPETAMLSLIILAVWQFGSPMLIFLAGLKDIPRSLYEAAEVDGSNPIQRFFHITIPMLSPIIFFNLVMQMISGMLAFTQAFVITEGGPNDRTLLYVMYMYNNSFRFSSMAYASAMAWFLLVMVGIITAVIFRSSSYWVFYESKSE